MKYYHSEVIKTKLEKRRSAHAFYFVITARYFLEHIDLVDISTWF